MIAPCYPSRYSRALSPSLPSQYTPRTSALISAGAVLCMFVSTSPTGSVGLPNHELPARYRRLAHSVRKPDAPLCFASRSQAEITCARRNCPSIGASRRAQLARSSVSKRETVPKLPPGTKDVCAASIRAWYVLHPSRSLSQDREGFSQLFLREMRATTS